MAGLFDNGRQPAILATHWEIQGIEGLLTRKRLQPGRLSTNLVKQNQTWTQMWNKFKYTAPTFAAYRAPVREANLLRFLVRDASTMGDGNEALRLSLASLASFQIPLWE